jgi:Dyp-type peroxidase family
MADGGSHEAVSGVPLGETIQAQIARASKLGDTRTTRDWGVYGFFRILPQAEFDGSHKLRKRLATAAVDANQKEVIGKLFDAVGAAACSSGETGLELLLKDPKRLAHIVNDPRLSARLMTDLEQPVPAKAFRNWLRILIGCERGPMQVALSANLEPLAPIGNLSIERLQDAFDGLIAARTEGGEEGAHPLASQERLRMLALYLLAASYFALVNPNCFDKLMAFFGTTPEEAGRKALSGGLLTTFVYEFLRQLAPVHGKGPAVLRPEGASRPGAAAPATPLDSTPVTYAFTFPGLKALKVDVETLESFPEPFKEGMAARAERLGDTGPSAPEHWDGPLGLRSVHGYFLGGHDRGESLPEVWRAGLRDDVRAFNEGSGIGPALRILVGALTAPLGLEVMHIEVGEDPYGLVQGCSARLPYRVEHFGFRDGVSQPFVDMGLRDTLPGGGTPGPNRTWAPLAPGEIFLGKNDDDDNRHRLPINPTLRDGGTFLVFRKLEQDVVRFRSFLAQQRPNDATAQAKLAAQFVGRWPNGTSLVTAPETALELGKDHEARLNDFLYAADDPRGLKCPLSAHVRRANPRDIGGTDDVRRHRILRRGMAYGGPLLPGDSPGDGNERGLLFICANARIDLQFEVIQADWLNKGELLGQAGLNRCPLTGANDGGPTDAFLEAGGSAPVTGVPRFVITRGGDYFFAPGLPALRHLAEDERVYFPPETSRHLGVSMGRSRTPALFSTERARGLSPRLLLQDRVVRYRFKADRPPGTGTSDATKPEVITFLARHADVKQVLSLNKTQAGVRTSVSHYHEALVRLSRGEDMLVSTEPGPLTGAKRERMQELLGRAWEFLQTSSNLYPRMGSILQTHLQSTLRRCGPSKRIDLVHDLAAVPTYALIEAIFGTPGPGWLTELAASLRFSQAHVGALQPDWIRSLAGGKVDKPDLTTMQLWSILLFLDIVGNHEGRNEAKALSEQAGSEFLTHLNVLIGKARALQAQSPDRKPDNLLEAFVILEKDKKLSVKYGSTHEYYTDVRMLLLELAGATLANIPATFGAVMETVFKLNINLTDIVPLLQKAGSLTPPAPGGRAIPDEGIVRLIYEATRITSPMQILMRRVAEAHDLPARSGRPPGDSLSKPIRLEEGEALAALIAVANFDGEAFPHPFSFSLHPYLDGPPRNLDDYLLFGPQDGGRSCWGRHFALFVIVECVKAAARLQGLQRVAGKAGDSARPLYVLTGLPARFRMLLPSS